MIISQPFNYLTTSYIIKSVYYWA